ncbi:uncharacterized protein M421DRAFT_423204 [Didymella exigua CBS 183.55]|uniref:Uncharacterized protein n=1 Tax=Didymella exigua CBS 183.55 TaxID=1150837 RepID=A0A6A5RCE4_9PLEO|nr:uncharacterized protein M421DRAFT_423204 [Didymella exigua CBS 183.55]KAF1925915.1 hypothetical protein M421DRAFT_423204 [Didymella exigua CBS 183.55]
MWKQLFRQEPLLPQRTINSSIEIPSRRSPILYVPLEIRLCIYAYLLPDSNPVSTSRALQATCKQLDNEVRREALNAFTRSMTSIQNTSFSSIITFFCASRLHVEAVILLPMNFLLLPTPRPRPLATTPFERSIPTTTPWRHYTCLQRSFL